MNYTVAWSELALAGLAAAWTEAADRAAVNAAADTIDRLLAAQPLVHGITVCEGLYAIEVPPLRALFEVDSASQTVTVVSVSRLP
jgi:plasmid stabilization system protein ParE